MAWTKKLVAVAVSNIAYIRNIFPEVAFANKSLDKMPLKILKQRSPCEDAGIAASWLLGAFEAIEKEYLKVLVLYCRLKLFYPWLVSMSLFGRRKNYDKNA